MGILQARILEWIAMPSSGGSSQPRDQTKVSCISVNIGIYSSLPQGTLSLLLLTLKVPLFTSQGDNLSLPTCEGLWHSWVFCVGNDTTCLVLTRVAQKFMWVRGWGKGAGIMESRGIFVYWYGRRYSISYHLWNGCKEAKLTTTPCLSLVILRDICKN